MKGSEKQITWANEIITDLEAKASKFFAAGKPKHTARAEELQATADFFKTLDSAAQIINFHQSAASLDSMKRLINA